MDDFFFPSLGFLRREGLLCMIPCMLTFLANKRKIDTKIQIRFQVRY